MVNNIKSYILLLLINKVFLQGSSCVKYTCNDGLNNEICSIVNPTDNNNFNVQVNLCGGTKYCNISDITTWSKTLNSTFTCVEKNIYPLVDLEKCIQNSDCASGTCSGTCLGKKFNQNCSATIECSVGTYCDFKIKKCLRQKKINSICSYSDECENSAGCYNNTCTKYFSLEEGTSMLSTSDSELYCSSGFAFQNVCAFLLAGEELPYRCNSTCNYTVRNNNLQINLPSLCTCGYNSDGFKYCQLPSDSIVFDKYKELYLQMLDRNCHVSKKGYCSNEITYLDKIELKNYYLSWKGKFQLTDLCLMNFYSNGFIIDFSYKMIAAFILLVIFF